MVQFWNNSQDCSCFYPFQKLFAKFQTNFSKFFYSKTTCQILKLFHRNVPWEAFLKLFVKFWSVNKHGISEWGLLALYKHIEILVKSSLKATKKKLAIVISKIQVSDPGPSWPSCVKFFFSCTDHRPVSLCHGLLSNLRLSVRPCVNLSFKKLIFSETTSPILKKFHRIVPVMVFFRIYWKNLIPSKTGCHGNKT